MKFLAFFALITLSQSSFADYTCRSGRTLLYIQGEEEIEASLKIQGEETVNFLGKKVSSEQNLFAQGQFDLTDEAGNTASLKIVKIPQVGRFGRGCGRGGCEDYSYVTNAKLDYLGLFFTFTCDEIL